MMNSEGTTDGLKEERTPFYRAKTNHVNAFLGRDGRVKCANPMQSKRLVVIF